MKALYFEDFKVGMEFITPGRTISEADVVMFSGISGDYNEIHTNEEFAKQTRFGTRLVHGVFGLSIVTGLMGRTGVFEGTALAMLEIKNWKFVKPIYINDTLYTKFTITETRKSQSNPSVGIVNRYFELINQHQEVVQKGEIPVMVKTSNK
jgi:acyl dehydratase